MMKLRELRQNHNLTQQNIAEYLDCSVANYSRYEIGIRQPSIEILTKLADFYHVSLDYLVGREEKESDNSSIKLDFWETALIEAFRNADPRARNDSLNLLLIHDSRTIGQES